MNLYRYPDGHAEMVMTRKRRARAAGLSEPVEHIDAETGEILPGEAPKPPKTPHEHLAALQKSAARARTTIRRAVMAGGLDHMITLTFRRNEQDLNVAWGCFARFSRLLRDELGGFQYVAVPERQKRGAWHIHCAARGKQDLDLLRRLWRRAGGDGAVNVTYRRDKPLHKLASYLSKYISKTFLGDEVAVTGRERYRRAQGLNPERVTETVTIDPAVAHAVMAALFRERGLIGCAMITNGNTHQVDYFVWGCTWSDPRPG